MKISPVNMEARKSLDLRVGDTVNVHQKIQEKDKTRIQQFQGLVLARKGGTEAGATFTVRRVTDGYGVEKIFPLYSPVIDKIEIVKRSKTRRAKLYNIRRQALKKISKRMKMMMVDIQSDESEVEEVKEKPADEAPAEGDTPTDAPSDTQTDASAEAESKEEQKTEEQTEAPTEEKKEEAPAETPKEEKSEEAAPAEETKEEKSE
jgi:large subunit ribosomal protein L19